MASANPLPRTGCSSRRTRHQTATSDFGHSSARVPETLHIAAYPRVFAIDVPAVPARSPLQVATFAGGRAFWNPA